MRDPRRLLENGTDDFEAKLLRAGRSDSMSITSRRKVMAGLGIAGFVPTSTLAATAKGAKGGYLLAGLGSTAKWVGGGLAGSVALWGGVQALSGPPAEAPQRLSSQVTAFAPPEHDPPPMNADDRDHEAPEPPQAAEDRTPGPPLSPRPARAAKPTPKESPGATPKTSLSEELDQIERARRAVQAGDHGRALSLLAEHRRMFSRPALNTEATVLRIEALVGRGDTATARNIGQQFLAKHANGPYAKRVKSLIGD